VTLRTAADQGTKLLTEGSILAPRLTAEVLLAHAIRRERIWLFSHPEEELTELGWIHFGRYLHQRLRGVPTQYITGKQEFYGREFRVTPAVLIPRPETEHLVTAALERLDAGSNVVDAGTGSGAIAVSLALERPVRVVATDISDGALTIARENASKLGARVEFLRCDLISALADASMDMVASNPPYVGLSERDGLQREVREHEPAIALFAGADGNAVYRRLIADAGRVLRPRGWLLLELGYRSADAVRGMLNESWSDVSTAGDLAGIPRVLAARRTS
jgi:release factor glutamine methyltransferase